MTSAADVVAAFHVDMETAGVVLRGAKGRFVVAVGLTLARRIDRAVVVAGEVRFEVFVAVHRVEVEITTSRASATASRSIGSKSAVTRRGRPRASNKRRAVLGRLHELPAEVESAARRRGSYRNSPPHRGARRAYGYQTRGGIPTHGGADWRVAAPRQ